MFNSGFVIIKRGLLLRLGSMFLHANRSYIKKIDVKNFQNYTLFRSPHTKTRARDELFRLANDTCANGKRELARAKKKKKKEWKKERSAKKAAIDKKKNEAKMDGRARARHKEALSHSLPLSFLHFQACTRASINKRRSQRA